MKKKRMISKPKFHTCCSQLTHSFRAAFEKECCAGCSQCTGKVCWYETIYIAGEDIQVKEGAPMMCNYKRKGRITTGTVYAIKAGKA